jgi:hypothetical protein
MLRLFSTVLILLVLAGNALMAATVGQPLPLDHVSLFTWLGGAIAVFGVSAISATNLTLSDLAKRKDPNGAVAFIIEMLSQRNEFLDDMVWKEGNRDTGELTTVRTGLPDVFWRLFNQGVATSKSTTAQIEDKCGMMETWSEIDKDLAELGGNAMAKRLSESRAFFEAMSQEFSSTLLYGTSVAPEEFIGLAARYADTTAGNGDNVILAGGTGSTDNTSIWLIAWDEEALCGIYPKGSDYGIVHEDLGIETAENVNAVAGTRMRVYRDRWQWKCGVNVKDWRQAVRVANIDVSNLSSVSDAADLIYYMEEAEERIGGAMGRMAFYTNRTIRRFLRHQVRTSVTNGGGITWENFAGKRVLMFGDTPIRRVDAILNTEDVIS